MTRPRRIVLLGGGFSDDPDPLLDDFILDVVRKERPKVCFIPTASGDSTGYIDRFHAAFGRRDCEPTHLTLFRRAHPDLRSSLLGQDVVYVGGGNTANLLAVWRLHGLYEILHEAYQGGVLLCGISAGAACWMDACLTDSLGPVAPLRDGLGLLSGSLCPHYDSEAERRPAYLDAIGSGTLPAGWALDDAAAALFTDGLPTEVVARKAGATLHRVTCGTDGKVTETALPSRLLTF
ncbi:peptidase E [Streptomyces sp. NBC_00201]|uniref:Type 1 glutamine amidotransferase-like domain-containing protein n=1 Tax=Streptomyces sp. NBC_00201 TaxID=2975679 RepID=UPI00224DF52A|nr:peptidase E [Streptomyces sp. NBC_00201]MCX5247144.1 peptidase E [Streptomyces sp. NBC_00201]